MTVKTVRMLMLVAGVAGLVYAQSASAEDATAPAKACPPAPAAEGKHHGPGGNPVEMMTKALNLTAEQQTQLKAIFDENHPKMKAIMDDAALLKEDKAAKMKELRTATDAKVRAVLTAEQQTKFDEMKAKHQQGKGGHHKAAPAAPAAQ